MTAKLIQVIEVSYCGGPIRSVTQYFTPGGTLLAERDPCPITELEVAGQKFSIHSPAEFDALNRVAEAAETVRRSGWFNVAGRHAAHHQSFMAIHDALDALARVRKGET